MIRRLVLENWRAYDRLDLELGPGTTFLVAANGIGKTSIVEGAAWALYGEAAGRPAHAVRKGAAAANATVDVVLPDQRVLRIARPMPTKLARTSAIPATALLDGAPLRDRTAEDVLRAQLAAEPAFLSRLTMLRGLAWGPVDQDALSLDENLSRVFGIDGLQRLLAELGRRRKELTRQINGARQTKPPSKSRLKELREEVAEARDAASAAADRHAAAREARREAEGAVAQHDALEEWQTADQRRREAAHQLAPEVAAVAAAVGIAAGTSDDPAEALAAALDSAERTLTERLGDTRVRRAVLADRLAALENALAELDTAAGQCPVCRRPLDPADADAARDGHRAELDALRAELATADPESDMQALDVVRALARRLAPVRHAAPRPSQPPHDAVEAASRLAAAEARGDAAVNELVAARAAAANAASTLAAAEQDEQAEAHLTALYHKEALAAAAAAATAAAIDGLMQQTVTPLADELSHRWKALFADRGELQLRGGSVSRIVNGHELPSSAFSDGEQASSQLLLRLLVLGAATNAGFCWIDEPLEHLDPAARRHIASLLSRAAAHSALNQVLVTTYEEPLARRLALRHPDEARVLYVRPDGTASQTV